MVYLLIDYKDNIYTYNFTDSQFEDTDLSTPLSETDFQNNGIDIDANDISNIPSTDWKQFHGTWGDTISFELYSQDNTSTDEPILNATTVSVSPLIENFSVDKTTVTEYVYDGNIEDSTLTFDINSDHTDYEIGASYNIYVNNTLIKSETTETPHSINYTIDGSNFTQDSNTVKVVVNESETDETSNTQTITKESQHTNKVLFIVDNTVYTYDNGWINTGLSEPISDVEFVEHGIDLEPIKNNISAEDWGNFYDQYNADQFEVEYFTTELSSTDSTSTYIKTFIPKVNLNIDNISSSEVFNNDNCNIVFDIEASGYEVYSTYCVYINDNLTEEREITTPENVSLTINGSDLSTGNNTLDIYIDEGTENEKSFTYTLIKEDRDTFTITDRFQYDKSYEFTGDVKLDTDNYITLANNTGEGEVIINIPTEGKYKITNVSITSSGEKEETSSFSDSMTHEREM